MISECGLFTLEGILRPFFFKSELLKGLLTRLSANRPDIVKSVAVVFSSSSCAAAFFFRILRLDPFVESEKHFEDSSAFAFVRSGEGSSSLPSSEESKSSEPPSIAPPNSPSSPSSSKLPRPRSLAPLEAVTLLITVVSLRERLFGEAAAELSSKSIERSLG